MITLNIIPEETIENLQDRFRKAFPFLNIECFSGPPAKDGGSAKKMMYPATKRLSECMKVKGPVKISVDPAFSVSRFEELLEKSTGLNAQVFRKAGKIWLETTATDSWSLAQQNEEGRKSQTEVREEIESPDDHDIY